MSTWDGTNDWSAHERSSTRKPCKVRLWLFKKKRASGAFWEPGRHMDVTMPWLWILRWVKRRGRLTFSDVPDKPRNVSVSQTRAKNENARAGRVGKGEFIKDRCARGGCVSEENSHPDPCGQVPLVTRQPLWANLSAVLVNHVTEARGYLTPVCEHKTMARYWWFLSY